MRKFSDKSCRGNTLFGNFFENRIIYEIMWKNIVTPDRPQMTIWRKRIAFCIPKTTNTHSEYVILIAFSLHQWLHKLASMSRYMYTACLLWFINQRKIWRECISLNLQNEMWSKICQTRFTYTCITYSYVLLFPITTVWYVHRL